MTTPRYEIKSVWTHGDVEVQHHFEASDPRFEVRVAGALKYIFVATRAWQTDRRTAIELASDLAGVAPPAPATAPAVPRALLAEKPVPPERVAPLVLALADVLYEENPAQTREAIMQRARAIVSNAVASGYRAFLALEEDVQMGTNQLHFDFEANGREKIVIYNRF